MATLVTGASGMLGTHLIERLLDEPSARVIGLDVEDYPLPIRAGFNFVRGDICDHALVKRLACRATDAVHCAAALPSYSAKKIHQVDVEGTQSLLSSALQAGLKRVVHISSTAVYGLPYRVPTPEDQELVPVDAYSAAKVAAEMLCRQARTQGLCVPILRPKTFLGPYRLGLFAMLFQWADEGRHFPVIGDGRVRCQLLDVQDLVDVVLSALRRPVEQVNDDFNIGAARFGTLREDFQSVLDEAGYQRRVIGLPIRPAVPVLRGLQAVGLSPVYRRLIYKLTRDSYVNIDRARHVLGFAPRYSNRDTILRTYRWWRVNAADLSRIRGGKTHREPWNQGALALARYAF